MSFGTKLQDARIDKRLTQEQLAGLLNVTRQSVSRWESDVVYPDLAKIVKLSEILEVSVDYLLKNDDFISKSQTVSRLLESIVGKKVKFSFYDGSELYDFSDRNADITVLQVDSFVVKISMVNKKTKKSFERVVPLSEIKSIEIMGE